MKQTYVIEVEVPEGVTAKEMGSYIDDAVSYWKGCFHPDEPLFHLDPKTIKVERVESIVRREFAERENLLKLLESR